MARSLKALGLVVLLSAPVLFFEAEAAQFTNRSFERGDLFGWEHIGDASVHGDELGVDPNHGRNAALLTNSLARNPVGKPSFGTEYGVDEDEFLVWLGLPPLNPDDDPPFPPEWLEWNAWSQAGNVVSDLGGHTGVRQSVRLRTGDVVSFDWNRVGDTMDGAFAILYRSDELFYRGIYAELTAPFVLPNTMSPWPCGSDSPSDPDCYFQTGWQSVSFAAPSDGDYTLVMGVFDQFDEGWLAGLWLDNFRVSSVAEPSALALVGLGFAGLAFTRRRRVAVNRLRG